MNDGRSSEMTCDELFDGELSIWQHQKGYRFGLDALLLATDLPDVGDEATIVDLGAGQGAVALSIAYRHPSWRVIAVERQESLLELLRKNVADNPLDNVEIVAGDLREHRDLLDAHSADLVVCNPPYYKKGTRRPSADPQKAQAHNELHGTLADFAKAAAYVLDQRGWLKMITPPIRLDDALRAIDGTDLSPADLRFFHGFAEDDAYLVEYRYRRGGAPDFAVRPPLFIYQSQGIYSPEVAGRIGRERR